MSLSYTSFENLHYSFAWFYTRFYLDKLKPPKILYNIRFDKVQITVQLRLLNAQISKAFAIPLHDLVVSKIWTKCMFNLKHGNSQSTTCTYAVSHMIGLSLSPRRFLVQRISSSDLLPYESMRYASCTSHTSRAQIIRQLFVCIQRVLSIHNSSQH